MEEGDDLEKPVMVLSRCPPGDGKQVGFVGGILGGIVSSPSLGQMYDHGRSKVIDGPGRLPGLNRKRSNKMPSLTVLVGGFCITIWGG